MRIELIMNKLKTLYFVIFLLLVNTSYSFQDSVVAIVNDKVILQSELEEKMQEFNLQNLNRHILKNVPSEFENYDVILGTPFFINQRRTMKFLKKGFGLIAANPKLLFDEKLRNIKFHFDLMQ